MASSSAPVKVIALTQEHRGHGTSTAAFFLSQALVSQHIPVLLGDLTGRKTRIAQLMTQFPTRNLVPWSPPPQAMRDLAATLTQAREQVVGKASCIILDIELSALEGLLASHPNAIDYLLIATENTHEGQRSAEQVAGRFDALLARNRASVVFARVDVKDVDELPEKTDDGLPVLGFWPADYRLAVADDYASSGATPADPHQPYQAAMMRIATRLIRLVPLLKP